MTEQEKQEIINAVLSAIRTNSNTINQLTPVTELSDDDSIEISGGKRVTYGMLMGLINTAFTLVLSNYVPNSTFTHDMTVLENALREALSNMSDTLYGKADVDNIGGAKHLKPQQAMLVSLQSVEQIPDSEGVNNKMWWSSDNGHLKYRHSDVAYDLGEPAYTLYYCGSKIYKWTGSGFTQVGGGEVVNDLETGGEEVALSAEMGKELNERLEDIEDSGTGGGVQIWVGTTDTENDTLFIVTNDTPYIRATPSSYDFGEGAVGGTSKQKSFTIKGKNLTGNSITAAITGAGFSVSPASIQVADGVANGTITVTFAPTGSLGERTGKLTLTCGEVTAEVALSGTAVEQVVPRVEFDKSSLSFAAAEGSNQTKTLAVSGRNLEGDVVLTSNDTAFDLSLDGSTFSSSVTLSPTSGLLDGTVYVRYTAGSSSVTGKTLTATSTNMSAVTVGLSGTVAELPSGYTKVFAITPAVSGAYIDTGIDISSVTLQNLKFQVYSKRFLYSNLEATAAFAGSTTNDEFRIFASNSHLWFYPTFNQGAYDVDVVLSSKSPTVNDDGLMAIECGLDSSAIPYVKDLTSGELLHDAQSTAVSRNYATGNVTLFRYKNTYGLATMSRFRMYNNGSLVLDMVACKRNNDNVYGMYDKKTNTFFASASEQVFTEVQQS